jgi:Secretion system C-terminal sorting domain
MKTLLITIFLFGGYFSLFSQEKHDYNWYLGYPTSNGSSDSTLFFGGTHLNFNNDTLTRRFFDAVTMMAVGATISDKNGNLLFYSNGCRIWNKNDEHMLGGDSINYNSYWEVKCDGFRDSYPSVQPLLSLPYPGSSKKYFVFYIRNYLNTDPLIGALDLVYSVVDMEGDNGLGAVVEHDVLVANDIYMPATTAVRHGNGRDWWIVVPTYDTKRIYTLLLTPVGLQGPYLQNTPDLGGAWSAGQIGFSPDGQWYAETFARNDTRLARFDRCTGTFYDFQPPLLDSIYTAGVSFSPNSERLYISRFDKIFQFDLTAPDIPASQQIVAEYDGYYAHYPALRTNFFQGILAPDNKIYLTSTNGVDVLHVIDHPDSLGLACGVRQHGQQLYTYHGFCVPNYPHYRTYDLHGAPCDTLGIDGPVSTNEPVVIRPPRIIGCQIYPNPATTWIEVKTPQPIAGAWQITDLAGRVILSGSTEQRQQLFIQLSSYASGTYIFMTRQRDGTVVRQIFVVSK